MARATADKVNSPSLAHLSMSEKWDLIRDLKGGTLAMRKAGPKWLPKEPGEEKIPYENRLKRTVLLEAYKETIRSLSSKPFSKPITVHNREKLNAPLEPMLDRADAVGNSLDFFSRCAFEDALDYGLVHIFVDAPTTGGRLNRAQEKGVHPYLTVITPEALLGWRAARDPSGKLVLTQIRWSTTSIDPVGEFGEREVEMIRVFKAPEGVITGSSSAPGTWQDYREQADEKNESLPVTHSHGEDGSSHPHSSGTNKTFKPVTEEIPHSYPGVPLVTFYTAKTGEMTGCPALEGLAWKNVEHWQKSSDQSNILRYARTYTAVATGVDPKEVKSLVLGPNQIIPLKAADAEMSILEHSGKAIEAGEKDLEKVRAEMEILGLAPLVRKTGSQTATGRAIDESRQRSQVQCWIADFELVLRRAFEIAAIWVKEKLPGDVQFSLFSDFGLSLRSEANVKALIDLWKVNGISHETLLDELKRYAVLTDVLDSQKERERIEEDMNRAVEQGVLAAKAMQEVEPDEDEDEDVPPDDPET